jgi:hypothetical protein
VSAPDRYKGYHGKGGLRGCWEADTRPEADPQDKARGRQHRTAATGKLLFDDNFVPDFWKKHARKPLRRVPSADLRWLVDQPWSRSPKWFPVRSYAERRLELETAEST